MPIDRVKNIGDVVIALTMASLAFALFFFDTYEKKLQRKIREAANTDHLAEERFRQRLNLVDVGRCICLLLAGCLFVAGASLVIVWLIVTAN